MQIFKAFKSKRQIQEDELSDEMPSKIQVIIYTKNEIHCVSYDNEITCEDVCISCCKELHILPTTRLLFGLYVNSKESKEWLFPNEKPQINVKYEFRMRFKVPELDKLYTIDPNAYEYLYLQIRHDMVKDRIDDIRYPAHKDYVLGLGVVDMYIDHLKGDTVEAIKKRYKEYIPKKILKQHSIFAQEEVLKGFQRISRNDKGLNYVKSSYMHQFARLAPNYLIEKYTAEVKSLPDGGDQMDNKKGYTVTVDLDLSGDGGPSIKVSAINQWFLVTKLENINALLLDQNGHGVEIDINGHLIKYHLYFRESSNSKSFMSYVTGYLRLMTKWMFDPCVDFPTPSLMELKAIKCHGPVGGDYSYAKIREINKNRGTFIVRQCEKEYDTYYIDIVRRSNHPETFKITKGSHNEWVLHKNGIETSFSNLSAIADAIQGDGGNSFQISPCDYDKPQLLLICIPRNLSPKTTDNEITKEKLQEKRAQIFELHKDIQIFIHSKTQSKCGKMTNRVAEWIQPNGIKNVLVTLKILNNSDVDGNFKAFMELTNKWSGIYTGDFLKMYGLTLTYPYAVIVEHAKYGPLDTFLQSKPNLPFRYLIDLAIGLVRAVAFMQEKGIYHGQIRCSSLMVTEFCPQKNLIVAKLADPGIRRNYDEKDLPWIPNDLYPHLSNPNRFDLYSERWAFATTMWEIFARGQSLRNVPQEKLTAERIKSGGILKIPNEWNEVSDIIMNGWSPDGDRFDKMDILRTLYTMRKRENDDECNLDISTMNISIPYSTFSYEIFDNEEEDEEDEYLSLMASVQKIPQGQLIRRTSIGMGQYGQVWRGEINYSNAQARIEVAIKVLKKDCRSTSGESMEDFEREIRIMQGLDHRNIVKIITYTMRPMSIVMEFLSGGSFTTYLSSNKPNLTNKKLLQFSSQIAEGMAYLSEMGIIHRDLAARNILIDGEIVKICDFGLAQTANDKGYYIMQHKRFEPIKWYALESLSYGKFSSYSDVWSYGVTLFEIFSRGETPDLEGLEGRVSRDEIKDKLKAGERLRRPELCPKVVYDDIMMPCWYENKKERPNFKEIIEIIKNIQNSHAELI